MINRGVELRQYKIDKRTVDLCSGSNMPEPFALSNMTVLVKDTTSIRDRISKTQEEKHK